MITIKTNLDLSDMANTLRKRLKGVNNKKFILNTINFHFYGFHFLTGEEYRQLRKEFNV